jgi:uncharacterized protein (TIGR02597 family)
MKKYISHSIILAAAATGIANGQATAYTTPVGYVSLSTGKTVGNAVPALSDSAISIPLERSIEFSGTVSSVSATQITVSGTPSLINYAVAGSPHIVKLASGVRSGLQGLITENTATTITISVPQGDSLTGVVAGDKFSITKAWTPLSLFGAATPAVGTQILGYSGLNPGVNLGIDLTYEYDGANWVDTNTFEVADNAVLYQGESLTIRNASSSPIASLVVSGTVPIAKSRIVISKLSADVGQDNAITYMGAAPETLNNSGLTAIAFTGDQILAIDNSTVGVNKGISTTIEFDGTSWIDTNSFEDVTSTFAMQPGVGYIYRRSASAPVGDVVWEDAPTYVSSL